MFVSTIRWIIEINEYLNNNTYIYIEIDERRKLFILIFNVVWVITYECYDSFKIEICVMCICVTTFENHGFCIS